MEVLLGTRDDLDDEAMDSETTAHDEFFSSLGGEPMPPASKLRTAV